MNSLPLNQSARVFFCVEHTPLFFVNAICLVADALIFLATASANNDFPLGHQLQ